MYTRTSNTVPSKGTQFVRPLNKGTLLLIPKSTSFHRLRISEHREQRLYKEQSSQIYIVPEVSFIPSSTVYTLNMYKPLIIVGLHPKRQFWEYVEAPVLKADKVVSIQHPGLAVYTLRVCQLYHKDSVTEDTHPKPAAIKEIAPCNIKVLSNSGTHYQNLTQLCEGGVGGCINSSYVRADYWMWIL